LRHERLRGAARDSPDRLRDLDVLGQIEVVGIAAAGGFRDDRIAIEGKARDDGVGLERGEVLVESLRVLRVKSHGPQVPRTVSLDNGLRRLRIDVTQGHVIITRFGQQPADERADLSGPQYENFVHEYLVWA
jgi:hypothetical protein